MFSKTKKPILWGGATSASQYEGSWDVGGKGIDTQDCRPYIPRTDNATMSTRLIKQATVDEAKQSSSTQFYPFRQGSKGYEHCIEDLELLKELGIEIYRFSISWARLFPTGEELEPIEAGLDYYDKIFDFLKANDIKVFLTLYHYAMPLHLVEKYGGWKNRQVIDHYLRFAKVVLERWGDKIDYCLPFNEINTGYFSPYNGIGLIQKDEGGYDEQDIYQALHHQFVANAKVIEFAKKHGQVKFGSMIAFFNYYPLTAKPEDNLKLVQDEQRYQWYFSDVMVNGHYPYYMNQYFKDNDLNIVITEEDKNILKNNTVDFVSISYYQSSVISTEESEKTAGNLVVSTKNPYLKATDWGWQIDPVGIRIALNKIYDRYQLPIIISENGIGAHEVLNSDNTVNDQHRIEYLEQHFNQILLAQNDGVEIEVYLLWGVIDIVSAGSCEMAKRYGVVYVDADNEGQGSYRRYKKQSFAWYQNFINKQQRRSL
ncbi:glycoside hydrolase family 1 protein [Globicatella sp. HMSC072A10]|uniref:glycoside hydrolase family 1 protein n=1 Tax=Globicatella sp. HMSC072A10 TaxID=1739315 RepID=UPI000AAC9273|nr:glycoside hydrolase family 1 protein [Globicatella sp. HMSC072A10]